MTARGMYLLAIMLDAGADPPTYQQHLDEVKRLSRAAEMIDDARTAIGFLERLELPPFPVSPHL